MSQPPQEKFEIWVAPDPMAELTAQAAPDAFNKVVAFLVDSDHLKEPTTDQKRVQAALKTFQRSKGLPETGLYDGPTKDTMNAAVRRCGVRDAKPSFVLQGGRWDHMALTFRIAPFTRDRTQESCRRIVTEAANLWARVSPLTFTEVPAGSPADIMIRWVTGDHGDGEPFETGPPRPTVYIVAHAIWPPPPVTELAGDVHFDERFDWRDDVQLMSVAAHEIGHALGLAHSAHPRATMHSGVLRADVFLHPDDIKGIHEIYGFRVPGWRRVPSSVHGPIRPSTLLAAGTTLFLLLENGWLLMNRAPPHSQFVLIDSSVSTFKITSFDGDTLFSKTLDGRIRKFSFGVGWEDVETDPNAFNIHATPSGRLVKLRNDGSIVELAPGPSGAWVSTQLSGPSDCVQCVVDGTTGRIVRRLRGGAIEREQSRSFGPPSRWTLIDRDPEVMDFMSVDTELFKLRRDGKVFRNNASSHPLTWEMINNNPRTKHIVAASRDFVYQLWDDGSLLRYYGAGWELESLVATTPPQTMQAVSFADGTLYIVEKDAEVWKLQN
jgi:hypothetical protein